MTPAMAVVFWTSPALFFFFLFFVFVFFFVFFFLFFLFQFFLSAVNLGRSPSLFNLINFIMTRVYRHVAMRYAVATLWSDSFFNFKANLTSNLFPFEHACIRGWDFGALELFAGAIEGFVACKVPSVYRQNFATARAAFCEVLKRDLSMLFRGFRASPQDTTTT